MRKTIYSALFILIFFFAALDAAASRPGSWKFDDRASFGKSEIEGFEVTHEGLLRPSILANGVTVEADYVWAVASFYDAYFLGVGDGARIIRVDRPLETASDIPVGETIWESEDGLEVYSLVRRGEDVYAGVSPTGEFLHFRRRGDDLELIRSVEIPDSYIWEILPTEDGVWISTGSGEIEQGGGIYRYDGRRAELIYRSSDAHVLSLALLGDNLYAGTQGKMGVVVRIHSLDAASPVATVLFDPDETEIVDLVAHPADDAVYALALGEDGAKGLSVADLGISIKDAKAAAGQKGGSTIYRISPTGEAVEWIDAKASIRAGTVSPWGLLIGTTSQGNIYRVDRQSKSTLLMTLDEENILSLSGNIVTATSPARLYEISGADVSAYLHSEILEAGQRSEWGSIRFRKTGEWEIRTRSGNVSEPDESWSAWSLPIRRSGAPVESPPGKYFQFEIRYRGDDLSDDQIGDLAISYKTANRAPVLTSVDVERIEIGSDQNAKLAQAGALGKVVAQLFQAAKNLAKGDDDSERTIAPEEFFQPLSGLYKVSWEAKDPDEEPLGVKIELIDIDDEIVIPVINEFQGSMYIVNTASFPDGRYRVRLTVFDDVGSEFGDRQTSVETSEMFLVDNTPPSVELSSAADGDRILIAGSAVDESGYIASFFYFDKKGVWHRFFPVDGIADQQIETFKIAIAREKLGSSVVIKAVDQAGNVGFSRIPVP